MPLIGGGENKHGLWPEGVAWETQRRGELEPDVGGANLSVTMRRGAKNLPRPCRSGSPPSAAESSPPPQVQVAQRCSSSGLRATQAVVAMAATQPAAALGTQLAAHSGMILGCRVYNACYYGPIKLPHHDVSFVRFRVAHESPVEMERSLWQPNPTLVLLPDRNGLDIVLTSLAQLAGTWVSCSRSPTHHGSASLRRCLCHVLHLDLPERQLRPSRH
ncbi:hypothetical protein NM208_g9867 [Fusarium decemcellulare]|uniref:Uncharacterized protein n=1 Tax=Fusarium decemcellulare TaxID=57161 RepID=A0ACC1S018_9HYPO|nr:hypothetical protein NM208_g9867 [Fusarium decemcellulare]